MPMLKSKPKHFASGACLAVLVPWAAPVDAAPVVVDNSASGFSAQGDWSHSSAIGGYLGDGYRYHSPGDGENRALWQADLSSTELRTYEVFVRWTSYPNRASDAEFTVEHVTAEGNATTSTVTLSQREQHADWVSLGRYPFAAQGQVALSDDADGIVVADAVKWVPVAPEVTAEGQIDNTSAGFSTEGAWSSSEAIGGFLGNDYLYSAPDDEAGYAAWTLDLSNADSDDVRVYAKWSAHWNRPSDATFSLRAPARDGALMGEPIEANQQTSNGEWVLLGRYDIDADTAQVRLSSAADGYVVADAVRWEALEDPLVDSPDSGDGSDGGDSLPEPIELTQQPSPQTVFTGQPASFEVTVSADGAVSYQWLKDGEPISGAQSPSYRIASTSQSDVGAYSVAVSSAAREVVSDTARLQLNKPASVTQAPEGLTVYTEHAFTLEGAAQGASPIAYQWLKDGTPIEGATEPRYRVTSASAGDAGDYALRVSNEGGEATSTEASVEVKASAAIDSQPQPREVRQGERVSLSVAASGAEPLEYQWQRDGQPISGATDATLVLDNAESVDAGQYRVQVSNGGGSVLSQPALLSVLESADSSAVVSWTAPSGRTDGSTLALSELSGYRVLYTQAPTAPGQASSVTVDNATSPFTTNGNWPVSQAISGHLGSDYQYSSPGSGGNSAAWRLEVDAETRYKVYARWSAHSNRASNAPYRVRHLDDSGEPTTTTVTVDQRSNGGDWVLLGTFRLSPERNRVTLSDDADGYVVADAVQAKPLSEADWQRVDIDDATQNRITISDLEQGTYHFRVKSRDTDGRLSEPSTTVSKILQ